MGSDETGPSAVVQHAVFLHKQGYSVNNRGDPQLRSMRILAGPTDGGAMSGISWTRTIRLPLVVDAVEQELPTDT